MAASLSLPQWLLHRHSWTRSPSSFDTSAPHRWQRCAGFSLRVLASSNQASVSSALAPSIRYHMARAVSGMLWFNSALAAAPFGSASPVVSSTVFFGRRDMPDTFSSCSRLAWTSPPATLSAYERNPFASVQSCCASGREQRIQAFEPVRLRQRVPFLKRRTGLLRLNVATRPAGYGWSTTGNFGRSGERTSILFNAPTRHTILDGSESQSWQVSKVWQPSIPMLSSTSQSLPAVCDGTSRR